MTLQERINLEFHEDYRVFSDVTDYDHRELRHLLDVHWNNFISLTDPHSPLTQEQKEELLASWRALREGIRPETDPEKNRIYLWEEGRQPSVTVYTENTQEKYADNPGFRPYLLEVPFPGEHRAKGAVILASGGAHLYRSNVEEAYESAVALTELGYRCFIVNYRVAPFTDEESACDFSRAVRIVRSRAKEYGISADRIAGCGFSYGGFALTFSADRFHDLKEVTGAFPSYVPDETDRVSGQVNACLLIYAGSPEKLSSTGFPPAFCAAGRKDEYGDIVMDTAKKIDRLGTPLEVHTFAGVPHGFGAGTHADGTFYKNAALWPALADAFLEDLYEREN